LILPLLSPGTYELFLASASNEATVAQGLRYGFLTAADLLPGAVTELAVEIEDEPSIGAR